MKFSNVEESLFDTIKELQVVDAHEHLPSEKVRLERKIDLFTLFELVVRRDLRASVCL